MNHAHHFLLYETWEWTDPIVIVERDCTTTSCHMKPGLDRIDGTSVSLNHPRYVTETCVLLAILQFTSARFASGRAAARWRHVMLLVWTPLQPFHLSHLTVINYNYMAITYASHLHFHESPDHGPWQNNALAQPARISLYFSLREFCLRYSSEFHPS